MPVPSAIAPSFPSLWVLGVGLLPQGLLDAGGVPRQRGSPCGFRVAISSSPLDSPVLGCRYYAHLTNVGATDQRLSHPPQVHTHRQIPALGSAPARPCSLPPYHPAQSRRAGRACFCSHVCSDQKEEGVGSRALSRAVTGLASLGTRAPLEASPALGQRPETYQ